MRSPASNWKRYRKHDDPFRGRHEFAISPGRHTHHRALGRLPPGQLQVRAIGAVTIMLSHYHYVPLRMLLPIGCLAASQVFARGFAVALAFGLII